LNTFLSIFQQTSDSKKFTKYLRKNFSLYRAAGSLGSKKVLFTGYFEPTFDGNLEHDSIHRYPIYRRPDNLLNIDLGLFRASFAGKRLVARIKDTMLVPYYTRKEITKGKVLEQKNLEIAWLKDPLDVSILQTQGSGMILLPNGEKIRVGYSATNGHPYKSIGRYMIDKGYISSDNLSLQTIRSYINQHPESKDEILNRSIAVDDKLFPKGALVYIRCQKPIIGKDGNITGWFPFSRFVLNQDTGGVIKGAGRGDIFWGSDLGSDLYAELAAGNLKHTGEMYFLVKKPDN